MNPADRPLCACRAGRQSGDCQHSDALHLACAEAAGARHIASLDNLLSRHAQRLKIKTIKIG
jgi:hypothetical protein